MLVGAAHAAHQAAVGFVEQSHGKRQTGWIGQLSACVSERVQVIADLLNLNSHQWFIVRSTRISQVTQVSISPSSFIEAFRASFIVNRAMLRWDTSARRSANMTAYIYRTLAGCFSEGRRRDHRQVPTNRLLSSSRG